MRSVLLAQGEFARFVKASADERAQLLESWPRTAIYSEWSELAHREPARRDSAAQTLETALGQVALQTEPQRLERATMGKAKETELAHLKKELEALQIRLGQAE